MIQEQIRTLLLDDATVGGLVGGVRVFLTPLKRPGSNDPDLAGYEPTPEAFEPLPPYFVQPSVVVNPAYRISDPNRRDSNTARWVVPLAYYAGPEGASTLELFVQYVSEAVDRMWIDLPGDTRGRIVVPHATSRPVDIPNLPGSGVMMLDSIEVAHVTR